jgi:hypothetical protein
VLEFVGILLDISLTISYNTSFYIKGLSMKKYLLIFSLFTMLLSATTLYENGRIAYQKEDYFKALKYFYASARRHNPNAYIELAIMYEKGIGTEPNSMTALYWYKKASKSGNSYAQKRLSTLKVTPMPHNEPSSIWKLGRVWSEDIETKDTKTTDDNSTSIWYWSELWGEDNQTQLDSSKEEDNGSMWESMKFWSDDNATNEDNSSIWDSMRFWDSSDIEDEEENSSSIWQKVKSWSSDKDSTNSKEKPTSRDILKGEEEW